MYDQIQKFVAKESMQLKLIDEQIRLEINQEAAINVDNNKNKKA